LREERRVTVLGFTVNVLIAAASVVAAATFVTLQSILTLREQHAGQMSWYRSPSRSPPSPSRK
jgi:hypothetical protein